MAAARITIVLFLLLNYTITSTSQEIQFTDMESLPEARSALTSASNDENIFVVNGFGINEQYTDEIFQYNLAQNSWSILTDSSISKRFASAAIVGDNLYVFNGLAENGVLNKKVEKLNLTDGTYEILSDNPQPCRTAGVATWNDKIYSFGGSVSPNEYSSKLYEYDPEIDLWTELAEIPFAGETKGEIVDGRLYIIGGYNGAVSDRIDVYDLTTNTWEANYTLPTGISAHSTAVVGSEIFLIGDFANLTSVISFDTDVKSFSVLTNNLMARRHCAAEGIGGSLFAIGGNTSSSIQSSISSVQKVDFLTSTNNITSAEELSFFPNPASNRLNFKLNFDELYIYNSQGQNLRRFKNVNEVHIDDLKSGSYTIKGYLDQKMFISQFIKI